MIKVTKLDGQPIVINANLVERIEARPDTIISMTTGRKLIVKETVSELIWLVSAAQNQGSFNELAGLAVEMA